MQPISLEDDAILICVTTARRVPKHYEPESKKTIAELIDRKVIAPVDKPTTWCSPTFFVPKVDGKRVRLVTDTETDASFPIAEGNHRGHNPGC